MITEDLSSQLLSMVALRGKHSETKEKTHAGYENTFINLTTHTQHLGEKKTANKENTTNYTTKETISRNTKK